MKWLDNLIVKRAKSILQTKQAHEEEEMTVKAYSPAMTAGISVNRVGLQKSPINRADFNRDKSMNFTLHPAIGGYILELSHYDEKSDRYNQRLHIINDDDDMGDSISKILTMELLRK